MPYNNQKLDVNWRTPSWSSDWDLWSIGMMTLEVIVGSELVLPLTTYQAVEEQFRLGLPGNILMDAPPHSCLMDLVTLARDKPSWRAMSKKLL